MLLHELSGHVVRFAPVETAPKFDIETRAAHMRFAMARNLPGIFTHPAAGFAKDKPLAILAGGPSLKIFKPRSWKGDTMVCGSAHDAVRRWFWHPTYAVCLDGEEGMAQFYHRAHGKTDFLIASTCHPKMFRFLRHRRVWLWHSAGDVDNAIIEGQQLVGGGSTVALRAIAIAVIFGYRDLHFFGLDSCLIGGHEHSYDHMMQRPAAFDVAVNGERFTTTLALIAQAQEFMQMWRDHRDLYDVTVYGNGLIANMVNYEANGP